MVYATVSTYLIYLAWGKNRYTQSECLNICETDFIAQETNNPEILSMNPKKQNYIRHSYSSSPLMVVLVFQGIEYSLVYSQFIFILPN